MIVGQNSLRQIGDRDAERDENTSVGLVKLNEPLTIDTESSLKFSFTTLKSSTLLLLNPAVNVVSRTSMLSQLTIPTTMVQRNVLK